MSKIKVITVIGKEWFDKVNGNSYHSADMYVDDKHYKVPFQYGYGDQYLQSAFDMLKKAIKLNTKPMQSFWQYCKEHKITLHTQKIEGCKKRDLK